MKTFLNPLKPAAFFIFISLMTGIMLGNHFPESKFYIFLILVLLSGLLCLVIFYYKKVVFIFILCLFCCLGYLSIQINLYPDLPARHISNYLDLKKVWITAKVVSFAKHYKNKYQITVLCQEIEVKDQKKQKVTGKIHLNIYGFSKTIPEFGNSIVFESTIRSVQNFMNPGAFDYKKFLRLRGIYGTAYSDIRNITILKDKDRPDLFSKLIRKIENIRSEFYYFIMDHTDESRTAVILASLITGKKELISPDMRELFSKAGISHLFAISGLHLSIVGLLFFCIFYRVLSLMPAYLIAGKSKKIAGILTLVPLICYSIFSGFSPSTQRALIMTIVLMISFLSEKEKDILSSLSIAGILILMIDSAAFFSISFQLSFMAVAFIVCGISLLKKHLYFFNTKLLTSLGLWTGVTFFAGLGTLPLTAHYFHIVSAITLISNFIFVPVSGFVVIPLGLVSLACFSFFPLFATYILHVCNQIILFSIVCSEALVSIPYSWSRVFSLQWLEIAVIYMGFVSIYFAFNGRRKVSVVILALSFLLVICNFSNDRLKEKPNTGLIISIIDVGQGSSALVETPEGKNILVDGGGISDISTFDTGRFIIAPFLWQKKMGSLDYVILTHPESDHLNGLIYILKNFKVHTLIKNADEKNTNAYKMLIQTCSKKNIRIWEPSILENQLNLGKVRLLFLDSGYSAASNDQNNNSLVFKVIYKDFSMLFPGDVLLHREESLTAGESFELHSDIMLSPHHGSSTSSGKFFLDKVRPKSVIISCGRHNRYNFPHDEVLKRYNEKGIGIFRTDTDGAVFISSDGKNYNIKSYKGG